MSELISGGDTRWIERGAYDLLGHEPSPTHSSSGMPLATALYGSLPEQLTDPTSFVSRLAAVLAVRKRNGIASGALLDVPDVPAPGLLVLVNRLETGSVQITALNFAAEGITGRVESPQIPAGAVVDLSSGRTLDTADDRGGFTVTLPPFGGLAMIVAPSQDA